MPQFRKGENIVKVMSASGPTARESGEALGRSEVAYFEFDMEFKGGLSINSMHVTLSDDPGTPEWDGSFSESIDIDTQEVGIYTLRYRTVDMDGRKSINSSDYIMEILAPLTPPNPPTGVA